LVGLFAFSAVARADVKISSKPTQNMTCTGGVCSPTAKKAVLNVTDLTNMLGNSDVTVKSDNVAQDIEVDASLSWTSTYRLTLDSYRSITFKQPLTVLATGGLTIKTDDGGSQGDFSFSGKGHIEFWDTHSQLIINGHQYVLLDSLKSFKRLLRNDAGFGRYFAQRKNWNESNHIRDEPPINLEFDGTFEALGNTISHFTVKSGTSGNLGLFYALGLSSTVRDLHLTSIDIVGSSNGQFIGALAGGSGGFVQNVEVSGQIMAAGGSLVGGLLGSGFGTVVGCSSSVSVQAGSGSVTGGLIGRKGVQLGGDISASYATGNVSNGGSAAIGGLVGEAIQGGTISNSFARGSVMGSGTTPAGGLIGVRTTGGGSSPRVAASYSTGIVESGAGALIGGSIGEDDVAGSGIGNDYWDLDTSGVSNPHQGAGNVPDDPGITGLTDAQLKSGLPAGFDPKVWAIDPKINNGYPYLINNPPPK